MTPAGMRPVVGVDAVVLDDHGRVLLGHRMDADIWNLPGGAVDRDESPWDAVARECREEVGITVTAQRLLGVFWQPRRNGLILDFLCEWHAGVPAPCHRETDEVGWFALDDLPENLFAAHIRRLGSLGSGGFEGECRFETET